MANKPRIKMPIEQRAKIFSPFSALKGLNEALAEKEKVREPKKVISEDMAAKIDYTLKNLKPKQILTVIFYDKTEERYLQLTGTLTAVKEAKGKLIIENFPIDFDDLYDVVI